MRIDFYLGKLINKRYNRLYSQGYGDGKISIEIDDKYTWQVFPWLNKRFENEVMDYRKLYLAGTEVLIVSLNVNLSEEIYFNTAGKLFDLFQNNKISSLFDEFLDEVK